MKKKKSSKKYKFFGYLLLVCSLIFFLVVLILNVLPLKYLLIVLGIIVVLDIIVDFFLLHPKVKDVVKKKVSIFGVLLIIIYGIISYYLLNTLVFLNTIVQDDYTVINYVVLVNKNSSINNIEDLRNNKVGYYSLNTLYNEEIPVSVDYDQYDDVFMMYEDLKDGKIEAILLEESSLQILEENIEDYDIRNLYSFSVQEKYLITVKDVDAVKEPFNVYISGIDTYGNIASVSRSDVNMVVTVNPKTKVILLTSIPRDYYVTLSGKGSKDKLTHAGLYGVDTSIKTIEDLLDININYYLKVNFTSVIDIVNILGGISVNSPASFTAWDGTKYSEGINTLNGEKALSFARERKAFTDGDKQRGKNQQEVMRAIINKGMSSSVIIKYNSILSSVSSKVKTNMPTNDITSLVKMQLKDKGDWKIVFANLDGSNGYEYTYSYKGRKLYVMIPDEESISRVHNTIDEVFNGRYRESN